MLETVLIQSPRRTLFLFGKCDAVNWVDRLLIYKYGTRVHVCYVNIDGCEYCKKDVSGDGMVLYDEFDGTVLVLMDAEEPYIVRVPRYSVEIENNS